MMILQQKGTIASSEKSVDGHNKVRVRGHKLTVTCVCLDSKDRFAFTGSKDGSIIKWCLDTRKILGKINPLYGRSNDLRQSDPPKHHSKQVQCLAISSDDRFLASGGTDKYILVWCPTNLTWIHTFTLHKQSITALAFRPGFNTLFSGSADRSIMLWTLEDDDNRCFVESFHGHESEITSIDVTKKERVLTSGGRDQSIRIWKIAEQAQTVFQSNHESVDTVKFIDDKTFVSGGEDGTLSIWTTMKRSPVFSLKKAHKHKQVDLDRKDLHTWISALATYTLRDLQSKPSKKRKFAEDDDSNDHADMSDNESDLGESEENTGLKCNVVAMIASGSCSSEIHVWKLLKSGSKYDLALLQSIGCPGFINQLEFSRDGKKLVAACGQEHRFGRWSKVKSSRNSLRVFDISGV